MNKAFSLVELMVVIAIVAILSAIAVPTYKTYLIKSRLNSTIPIIYKLIQRSIEFSNMNGYFGNAYDLGLTTSVPNPRKGATTVATPSATGPYFSNGIMWIGDNSGAGTNCGSQGTVQGYLDPAALGFSSSVANSFEYGCLFRHYNGVITTKCFYSYGVKPSGASVTEELIPSWINSNATANWDGTNWNNGNLAGWNQSCM